MSNVNASSGEVRSKERIPVLCNNIVTRCARVIKLITNATEWLENVPSSSRWVSSSLLGHFLSRCTVWSGHSRTTESNANGGMIEEIKDEFCV